jgi:hypothetical protein
MKQLGDHGRCSEGERSRVPESLNSKFELEPDLNRVELALARPSRCHFVLSDSESPDKTCFISAWEQNFPKPSRKIRGRLGLQLV